MTASRPVSALLRGRCYALPQVLLSSDFIYSSLASSAMMSFQQSCLGRLADGS